MTLYVVALVLVAAALVRAVVAFVRDSSRLHAAGIGARASCAIPSSTRRPPAPDTGSTVATASTSRRSWSCCSATVPLQTDARPIRGARRRSAATSRRRRRNRSGRASAAQPRRRHARLVGAVCLTVAGAHDEGVPASRRFFSGWHNGDAPMEQVLSAMRAHHITDAYGDYWTAYDLDFLSRRPAGREPVARSTSTRSASIAATVATPRTRPGSSSHPARRQRPRRCSATPSPGPGPYTEQTFEALLAKLGIAYRSCRSGFSTPSCRRTGSSRREDAAPSPDLRRARRRSGRPSRSARPRGTGRRSGAGRRASPGTPPSRGSPRCGPRAARHSTRSRKQLGRSRQRSTRKRDEARAGGDDPLGRVHRGTNSSSRPGTTSRTACSVITTAEERAAQRRIAGGVDGGPGQSDGPVTHGGVGRGGDAGGGELPLVVHGAVASRCR